MYQKKLPALVTFDEVDPTQIIQDTPTHLTVVTPEFNLTLPVQYTTLMLESTSELVFEFSQSSSSPERVRAVIDPTTQFRYFDSRSGISKESSTWRHYYPY